MEKSFVVFVGSDKRALQCKSLNDVMLEVECWQEYYDIFTYDCDKSIYTPELYKLTTTWERNSFFINFAMEDCAPWSYEAMFDFLWSRGYNE